MKPMYLKANIFNGVHVHEYDISEDEEARVMSHKDFYNSLPGLVDGEESITFLDAGDDEFYAKLRDEYGIH